MESTTTCDWCRSRKVKCMPLESSETAAARSANLDPTCQRCFRRRACCTFDYVMKRPGRPKGSSGKRRRSSAYDESGRSDDSRDPSTPASSRARLPSAPQATFDPLDALSNTGPDINSLFGSAKAALTAPVSTNNDTLFLDAILSKLPTSDDLYLPAHAFPSLAPTAPGGLSAPMFDFSLPSPAPAAVPQPQPFSSPHPLGTAPGITHTPPAGINPAALATSSLTPQGQTDSLPSLVGPAYTPIIPLVDVSLTASCDPTTGRPKLSPLPSIELVAPWQDICFFVSLHMKHQHALVPLVHKPSFAQDMLHRRDEHDEQFRGLLSSMVAYTICQVPFSLMGSRYLRHHLETFFFRAQNLSRAVQLRHAERPTLTLLASVILDAISCQAADSTTLTDVLMSEARRLIFHLRLNLEEPQEGLSLIDRELSRRLYWEFWAVSKTGALNGHALLLYELEGVPPLPLTIDDEYLSAEGHLPQPTSKLSYMTGFITVTRIFRILGQCLVRHRALLTKTMDLGFSQEEAMEWTARALRDVRELADSVVRGAQEGGGGLGALGQDSSVGVMENAQSWRDIQCANCLITALCTEFSLLEYKASLSSPESVREDRQTTSKRAYQTLSSMPVEYLASNGESMRGKVLRIILSLLGSAGESEHFGEMVWEWWNMYSKVQFVQVIPQVSGPQA